MTEIAFTLLFLVLSLSFINGEDPYKFLTWNITYGDIWPLGVKQQGILINGQFPGPQIESVTNENLIINVFNSLDEPFLISWNGIQQRRNSWQDGVYGTNCPIPPGNNFTYVLQVKDQIGSYFYFPSLGFHKAAGGFGGFKIQSRSIIPIPFPTPAGEFTVLAGDWYSKNHTDLRAILDGGSDLPFPDGVLINGRGSNGNSFIVEQGNTYRFRISNVGLATAINFRIQGHKMLLVEVEGTHTLQNTYESLDIHLGQSYSVLVTADQPPQDYYIVVSTRFTSLILTTTNILHYSNSAGSVSAQPQPQPQPQPEMGFFSFLGRLLFASIFILSASQMFNEFGNNGGPAAAELSLKVAVLSRNLSSKLGVAIPDIEARHWVTISSSLKGLGGLLFVFGSSIGAHLLLLQLAIFTPVLYDFFNYSPQNPTFSILLGDFLQHIALFGALLFFLGMKNTVPKRQPKKKTPKTKTF